MELKETINTLKKLESRSVKKQYLSDATQYSFFRHALIMLSEISEKLDKKKKVKSNRKPSTYSLFLKKEMGKGLSMKEAAKKYTESKVSKK